MVGLPRPPVARPGRRHDDRVAPSLILEIAMRHPIDVERRTLMIATSVLGLAAVLRPQRARAQAPDGKLRIGTIGAGRIGGTVGGLWVKAGHPVMFSAKNVDEAREVATRLGSPARAGTVEEAIAFGDVVFLAVPYGAMEAISRDYGASLKGKIVLDCGNAVPARDGAIADVADREGIGLTSQKFPARRAPRARVSTPSATPSSPAKPVAPTRSCRSRSRATTPRPSGRGRSRQEAGFEPVVAGGLAEARRFQRGAPGYGPSANAAELREKLRAAP
jgi:predicted dinucleotide-binding enzyme